MPAAPLPQFDPFHAIFRMEWALISVLHPLTGERSAGTLAATVSSGTSPVVVPAGHYAVPLIQSGTGEAWRDFGRMVKTYAETTVDPVADPLGTTIPFVSVSGGARQNLDRGTDIEWYPEPPPGISDNALSAAGSSGATDPTGAAAIRQVLSWEGMGMRADAEEIWRAGTDAFPAVIVAWVGASDAQRLGPGKMLRKHQFEIFVVVSRLDGGNRRRDEGKIVLSAVERELGDRAEVDGEIFSSPPTVPGALSRVALDPGSYVYSFRLQVSHTSLRTERRTFRPLTKLAIKMPTPDDGVLQPPDPAINIVDTTEDVPGG